MCDVRWLKCLLWTQITQQRIKSHFWNIYAVPMINILWLTFYMYLIFYKELDSA